MAKTKKKDFWQHLALFFAIFGPGFITGSVDNDVGGITTYSVAGATYGYQLLWTLIPAAVALFVVQEMNARMGVVTGKGLADLIRENAGVKATCIIFLFLLGADVMNTTTEFAGVAGSMQIFGVSKYISVPIAASRSSRSSGEDPSGSQVSSSRARRTGSDCSSSRRSDSVSLPVG